MPGHAHSDGLKSRFSNFRHFCGRRSHVVHRAGAVICYAFRSQPSVVSVAPKPAALASLVPELLKVEVATSLGVRSSDLADFREILTFRFRGQMSPLITQKRKRLGSSYLVVLQGVSRCSRRRKEVRQFPATEKGIRGTNGLVVRCDRRTSLCTIAGLFFRKFSRNFDVYAFAVKCRL